MFTGKNAVVCSGGYQVKLIGFQLACKVDDSTPLSGGWTHGWTRGWTSMFASPEVEVYN